LDKEDIQGYDDFVCNCLHSLESAIECTCFDKEDDDEMKFTKVIDSFDSKVMYGFSEYEDGKGNKEGFILLRFEESNVSGQRKFYTEQKIHIDNKVKETIKRWLNEG